MQDLDEVIYEALTADTSIVELTGGRIRSTCFEVPPTDADNTPLPYIIITDDPFQNEPGTKDDTWESDTDAAQAGIEIGADSPKAVKQLRRLVRHAIASHIADMDETVRPQLRSLSNDGIAWDWTKPCYYDRLRYLCDIYLTENDNE